MRAICEACSQPQPVDWKAGDLCVHCGQPVQREVRCFWCARWTPAAKYCRRCGAAVLDESLYGAARMLRDAGTDRFTVPKLLSELDVEQVENFTRIYQRHAVTLHRHVDQVRFLENYLHQRHWSQALEDELVTQLPWPDERLDQLSAAMGPEVASTARNRLPAEDLATTRAILVATPFPVTRSLAAITALLLDDWSLRRDVKATFTSADAPLHHEATLALTGWRVVSSVGFQDDHRELMKALRESPLHTPAAVRLAMLGDRDIQLPAEAPASPDPGVRFMAALASGHLDTLLASLRSPDELERFAAAQRLVELGASSSLGETLRAATPDHQVRLLKGIASAAKEAPGIREAVYEIAAGTAEKQVRQAAVRVLCYGCPPHDVERLAAAARGESTSYQAILQTAGFPPDSLQRLCAWFLEHGVFSAEQWGMRDIAKAGRMPAGFVPRFWDKTNDEGRIQLCRFAECQLEEYADEDLHRFLVNQAFAIGSVPVRSALWTSLYRWYRRQDVSGRGQIFIQRASLERFFGSVPRFVEIFTAFLLDPNVLALLEEYSTHERIAHLVRYTEDDALPELAGHPAAVQALADAVVQLITHAELNFIVRIECVGFLAWLGRVPELHDAMRRRVLGFKGTDLDHAANMALERLDAVK